MNKIFLMEEADHAICSDVHTDRKSRYKIRNTLAAP